MKNLRIAALTIVAALLVVGLTVPFGTALAGSKHDLNFKSIDVALPGVTFTAAFGINAQGDIVGHRPSNGFHKRNLFVIKHLLAIYRQNPVARRIFWAWIQGRQVREFLDLTPK